MRVILGIGNPGAEYEGTRHNAGFHVIEELARRAGTLGFERNKKWKCEVAQWNLPGQLGGGKALLVKPQTFVNLSGSTAQACLAFYKCQPSDLLVVVDDIHLTLGTLRLRAEGSSGGHNGLKDIEQRIGKAYPRLRVGIGAPSGDQVGHVLGRFAPDERDDATAMTAKAADCAMAWLGGGIKDAMCFNGPLHPPAPKPKPAHKPKPDQASSDQASDQADPNEI
ncbi:MAG: aminoacyl-tRNA hydrolase [Planctomycetota bacterium]|jgi:PTH1 family peptidyl-tRNA hydrolase|nr:aminoacyl-tRNA hydrolase [Planctomycetota bacterium]